MSNDYMIEEQTDVATKLKEPPLFNVIFLNDDKTPMEFVIVIICQIFGKSEQDAINLTMMIHEDGAATIATMAYEIAEMKGNEVVTLARQNSFPLKIRLEADE